MKSFRATCLDQYLCNSVYSNPAAASSTADVASLTSYIIVSLITVHLYCLISLYCVSIVSFVTVTYCDVHPRPCVNKDWSSCIEHTRSLVLIQSAAGVKLRNEGLFTENIYVYRFEDDAKHLTVHLKRGCKSVTFRFHFCFRHGCHTANDEKHEHTPHKHTHTHTHALSLSLYVIICKHLF